MGKKFYQKHISLPLSIKRKKHSINLGMIIVVTIAGVVAWFLPGFIFFESDGMDIEFLKFQNVRALAYEQTYINNGSFEVDESFAANPQPAQDWEVTPWVEPSNLDYDNSKLNYLASFDAGKVEDKSFKINIIDHGGANGMQLKQKKLALTQGKSYVLRFWLKTDRALPESSYPKITVDVNAVGEKFTSIFYTQLKLLTPNIWKQFEHKFNVPNIASRVDYYFMGFNFEKYQGNVWIDGMTLAEDFENRDSDLAYRSGHDESEYKIEKQADYLQNGSFEFGLHGWIGGSPYLTTNTVWSIDENTFMNGKRSIRTNAANIDWITTPYDGYYHVLMSRPFPLEKGKYLVSAYMKTNAPRAEVVGGKMWRVNLELCEAGLDESLVTFESRITPESVGEYGIDLFNDWRKYFYILDTSSFVNSRKFYLRFVSGKDYDLWIDDVHVSKLDASNSQTAFPINREELIGANAVLFDKNKNEERNDSIYTSIGSIALKLEGVNNDNSARNFSVKYLIKDFWEREVASGNHDFVLSANSNSSVVLTPQLKINPAESRSGFFKTYLTIEDSEKNLKRELADPLRFVIFPSGLSSSLVNENTYFGISGDPITFSKSDIESQIKIVAESGAKMMRECSGWCTVQKDPLTPSYDFSAVDYHLNMMKKYGITPLLTLGTIPGFPNVDPTWQSFIGSPNFYSTWENYVRAMVNRYKGNVKYWEIWNEADHWFGYVMDRPDIYAEMIKRAYEIIKELQPNSIVSDMSTASGFNLNFREGVYSYLKTHYNKNMGDYNDIVTFHAIRDVTLQDKEDLIDDMGGEKPVWMDEHGGYYVQAEGYMLYGSSETKAILWSRDLIRQKALGLDKFFYYGAGNWPIGEMSITYLDGTPQPLLVSYASIANLLEGSNPINSNEELIFPEVVEGYAFFNPSTKKSTIALWSTEKGALAINLNGIGSLSPLDMFGNPILPKANVAVIDESPIFIQKDVANESGVNPFIATVQGAIMATPQITNIAPIVNAGVDQTITLPNNQVSLFGTATDDGLPDPPANTNVIWTKVNGPGKVNFTNPYVVKAGATFSSEGTYVLRITANDGILTASDEIKIMLIKPAEPATSKENGTQAGGGGGGDASSNISENADESGSKKDIEKIISPITAGKDSLISPGDSNGLKNNNPLSSKITSGNTEGSAIKSLYGLTSALANSISYKEATSIFEYNSFVPLNALEKRLYVGLINKARIQLTLRNRYAIAMFIHYGTQTTQRLGAGERVGVIGSYQAAFNKLPRKEAEWQDVIKLANGRWLAETNKDKEEKTKQEIFKKIYKRVPDMANANDNAAVKVMTYGLRPAVRNTESEKVGIRTFKGIYGYNPSSASDWDIARAIAYSGAKR